MKVHSTETGLYEVVMVFGRALEFKQYTTFLDIEGAFKHNTLICSNIWISSLVSDNEK